MLGFVGTQLSETVAAMFLACPAYDLITRHDKRVSFLSLRVAKKLGFSETDCRKTALAGLVHDIGKTATPEMRLLFGSPSLFSREEKEKAKLHCPLGVDVLRKYRIHRFFSFDEVDAMEQGCLYHHDDFSRHPSMRTVGIPDIIRVVDSYDAMVYVRSYKPTKSVSQALAELVMESGRLYDPRVVQAVLELKSPTKQ